MLRVKLLRLLDRGVRRLTPEMRIDPKSLQYLLHKKAIEASDEFIHTAMPFAEAFETRESLYRYVIGRMPEEGLILEFGVHNGNSVNAIAALTERAVHGFDSFEGLPDDGEIPGSSDGGVKWYAGKSNEGGRLPLVRTNVRLHRGWFEEQLPSFYHEHEGPAALIHVDCDIYSSTKCVLECSRERLRSGTIIVFDEYMNYFGWQKHEHRALTEFASATGLRYEFIAYTFLGGAAIRVLGYGRDGGGADSVT